MAACRQPPPPPASSSPPGWFCPRRHYYKDCPTLRDRKRGAGNVRAQDASSRPNHIKDLNQAGKVAPGKFVGQPSQPLKGIIKIRRLSSITYNKAIIPWEALFKQIVSLPVRSCIKTPRYDNSRDFEPQNPSMEHLSFPTPSHRDGRGGQGYPDTRIRGRTSNSMEIQNPDKSGKSCLLPLQLGQLSYNLLEEENENPGLEQDMAQIHCCPAPFPTCHLMRVWNSTKYRKRRTHITPHTPLHPIQADKWISPDVRAVVGQKGVMRSVTTPTFLSRRTTDVGPASLRTKRLQTQERDEIEGAIKVGDPTGIPSLIAATSVLVAMEGPDDAQTPPLQSLGDTAAAPPTRNMDHHLITGVGNSQEPPPKVADSHPPGPFGARSPARHTRIQETLQPVTTHPITCTAKCAQGQGLVVEWVSRILATLTMRRIELPGRAATSIRLTLGYTLASPEFEQKPSQVSPAKVGFLTLGKVH
ncbi:hypothetical protein PR048_007106 [Dryococelus australis]|uniref:Uncharacterized protein n=1 Tax=Dryococelus australis TaxID=614101 RepID=A0ABQ9ICP5_9NEOP|nr:hypothetical protein PR048_007106 [Dryococelus australis]